MEKYTQRSCPVCNKSLPAAPVVTSTRPAETLEFEELKKSWSGHFKEKIFFSYHRCEKCGLLYCPVFFSNTQLAALYAKMPDNTAGISPSILKRTQKGYFEILRKYSPLTGQYIELGPDIGLFTEHVIRGGKFEHYWLFEPNRNAWPELSQRLHGKPYHLFPEMFEFSSVDQKAMSAAVIIHVLDHILDPVDILKKIRRILADDAIVLIVTHDEASILAKVLRKKWPPYCLQHPELYNPSTISRVLDAAGFRVLSVTKTCNYFPLGYILKHALWATGLRNKGFPALDRLQVGLRLGNILTIATPAGH